MALEAEIPRLRQKRPAGFKAGRPLIAALAAGRAVRKVVSEGVERRRLQLSGEAAIAIGKMMRERREAKRIVTDLPVRWDGPRPSQEGKIIDLSVGGCFILSASQIPPNTLFLVKRVSKRETLQLELYLTENECLKLQAEVVYRVGRVGFAARFLHLALADEEALRAFVETQGLPRLNSLPFPRIKRAHKR